MPMFKNYFKTAWRNLVKDKMHSFINIAGLSIGMAVAILLVCGFMMNFHLIKILKIMITLHRCIQNLDNNGEVETWTSVPYPLGRRIT